MNLLTPLLLALAMDAAAPAPQPAEGQGKLWREASAPFRRRAQTSRPTGHLAATDSIQKRRALRSPFSPPAGDLPDLKKLPPKAKVVGIAEGSLLLEEIEQQIGKLSESMDGAPPDRLLKTADALGSRLAALLLSSKPQREKAETLSASLAEVRGRLERRAAFAALNPRVKFIIWAPEGQGEGAGKSLAVVNQRVLHEGDVLVPGVTVGKILQHEVRFDLGGEQVAVGLK